MSLLYDFERSRRRRQMQNYFWPWSLFVLAVGILFFQLGKVSQNNTPHALSSPRFASPVFHIPGDRPRAIKKTLKSRGNVAKPRPMKVKTKAATVTKKSSKKKIASAKSDSKPVSRMERKRGEAVGAGPKLVRE